MDVYKGEIRGVELQGLTMGSISKNRDFIYFPSIIEKIYLFF